MMQRRFLLSSVRGFFIIWIIIYTHPTLEGLEGCGRELATGMAVWPCLIPSHVHGSELSTAGWGQGLSLTLHCIPFSPAWWQAVAGLCRGLVELRRAVGLQPESFSRSGRRRSLLHAVLFSSTCGLTSGLSSHFFDRTDMARFQGGGDGGVLSGRVSIITVYDETSKYVTTDSDGLFCPRRRDE